jgi:hypothetical protein
MKRSKVLSSINQSVEIGKLVQTKEAMNKKKHFLEKHSKKINYKVSVHEGLASFAFKNLAMRKNLLSIFINSLK